MIKKIYTDIVGDLFHYGHINLIKKARKLGDYVIVGVMSDELVERYKRRPVLNLEERVRQVSACRFVDEVIPAAEAPLTKKFIINHKIDLVIRGNDLSEDGLNYWYSIPKKMGILKTIPYTEGVSTTDIIQRIINRYESNSI